MNLTCPLCDGTLVKILKVKDGVLMFKYGCPNCSGYSFLVQVTITVQEGEIWAKED